MLGGPTEGSFDEPHAAVIRSKTATGAMARSRCNDPLRAGVSGTPACGTYRVDLGVMARWGATLRYIALRVRPGAVDVGAVRWNTHRDSSAAGYSSTGGAGLGIGKPGTSSSPWMTASAMAILASKSA